MPRNQSSAAMEHVHMAAKLADLKGDHLRLLLTLGAMTELLIDKGLLTREELEQKTAALDLELDLIISASLHPMA
ncbi:hypothetical protein FHS18_002951 [Paenibacillus phyllosphaerae]|uniref:Uncharacterized protein n=1 Tax=Paenibacillus phyllosphaerae TaxID=274593 RepID=A0A7W5AY25_9BACL|nr:hypothetical protein [Paenibacillus phyllosphaerae]MBB3110884.1 hypothetical protein [Paenibacillus phyllosphaerae]